MKRIVCLGLSSAVFVLCFGSAANANSLFVILTVGATAINCDNGSSAGVATCLSNGFTTSLNSNLIEYSSTNFNGYSIVKFSLTSNSPGTSTIGYVADTKTSISQRNALGRFRSPEARQLAAEYSHNICLWGGKLLILPVSY